MIIAESMGFGSNFGIKGELKETDAKAACVCVCNYLCVHVCVCVCVYGAFREAHALPVHTHG